MGKNFRETLNKQMANPEFKAEYDALEPEFQIIQAIVDARNRSGLTQKQLSEKTGIAQFFFLIFVIGKCYTWL
mgnify:CR=1 FL=1